METTNENLTKALELVKEMLKKSEKGYLFVYLTKCRIIDRNGNKIIIACFYLYHKEVLSKIENKLVIEKYLSEVFEMNVSVEFVEFDKAIKMGNRIALIEKNKIDKEKEEKYRRNEIESKEREREYLEKKIAEIIESKIPLKFKNAKIDNSSKIVRDYYYQGEYKEKGLFLFGDYGVGKTYNVYALAKCLIMDDVDVWVFNLPRLLNIIRTSFSKQEAYNEDTGSTTYAFVKDMSGIEELIRKEILIIDDIGAEKPSDWVAEILYYLINSRYENMKTTIFTSNLSLDKLSDRIGDRIVSRIAEMCDVHEIKGVDRRLN